MQRKASFEITVTRRETLSVGDTPNHCLILTELEGEPVDYTPGVAGEFVSRRSVGFHDRIKGTGPMQGYAITHYQLGAVYSRFEGQRDGASKVTSGTWKVYKGTGKLSNLKGNGNFTVRDGKGPGRFILEMEGEYEL